MIQRYLFFVLVLVPLFSYSQGTVSGKMEKKITSDDFSKNFSAYNIYSINPKIIQQELANRNDEIHLSFGNEYNWKLRLFENDVMGENYVLTILTEEGRIEKPRPKIKTYHGLTDKNEQVRLTLNDHFLYGYITQDDVKYFIEPASYFATNARSNSFVIYSELDVIDDGNNKCAVIEMDEAVERELHNPTTTSRAAVECAEVELAIASDYRMVQRYGSPAQVEAHNIGVMNNVQMNYDDEFDKEIRFKIVTQLVSSCESCDPFSVQSGIGQTLGVFRNWGNQGGFGNITYDLAQFWSNRNFAGNAIGVAYLLNQGVMCTSQRYHVIQDFSNNSSLTRVVVAHEIGHNFSARHSSAGYIMNWSVNNTNNWSNTTINSIDYATQKKLDNGCLTDCTTILPPDLGDPDQPLTLDFIDSSPETCFGANDGSINILVSGGFPNYGYFWNDVSLNGPNVKNLSPGIYSCTIVDINNASVIAGPIVIDGSSEILTITVDDIIPQSCEGGFTGGAHVSAHGGVSPYFFSWSNGYQDDHISEIDAGTYSVTVLDVNGCFATVDNIVIPTGSIPNASAISIAVINCNQQVVTLNGQNSDQGSNNYFLWTTDDGNILDGENTLTPIVDAAGTYLLTVYNGSDDCFATSTVTVVANFDLSTININPNAVLDCNNPSMVINANISGNNNQISWTTTDGNMVSGANSSNLTIDTEGTYLISVFNNDNGCQSTATVVVTSSFDTPNIDVASSGNLDCNTISSTLTATIPNGDISVDWSTADGHILSTDGNIITVDQAGSYTLIATDNTNGCFSTITTLVLDNSDIPQISVENFQQLDCNHSTVTINAIVGDGFNYAWTTNNGNILNGASGSTITVDQTGIYSILVTNTENGCQAEAFVTVVRVAELAADIDNIIHNSCFGGEAGQANISITSGTAPFNYIWTNGSTDAAPSNLVAGIHEVSITDAAGCIAIEIIEITEPSLLSAEITESNSTLTVNANGGTAPYNYVWQNDETTQTISASASGTYTVVITDANGCIQTRSIVIDHPECNISSNISATHLSCFNAGDGSASITLQGATGDIIYQWSNDSNLEAIANLDAGTYNVTATDASDCEVINQIIVTEPNPLIATTSQSDLKCFGDQNAFAEVSVDGGTAPYTYLWNTESQDNKIDLLGKGTYSITTTDVNNCEAIEEITISEPDQLELSPIQSDVLCNSDGNGSAEVVVVGGTTPYDYNWNIDSKDNKITNLSGGDYSCEVMDNNGCTEIQNFVILESETLTIKPLVTNVSETAASDGEIIVGVNGGTEPYSFLWDDGDQTNHRTGLSVGHYSLDITDANICSISVDFEITEPGVVVLEISKDDISCFGVADGTATANPTQGEAPFTYLWSNSETTQSISSLEPGTYSVVVTDYTGVSETSSIEIIEPSEIELFIITHNVLCAGDNNGSIDVTVSGGVEPYAYAWDVGNGKDLPAGEYGITVTDANDCNAVSNFVIFQPEAITTSETITNSKDGETNGAIALETNGGSAPYSYLWNNGETSKDINGLLPGSYSVKITDNNDCILDISFEVESIVGTNQVINNHNLSINPNPSHGDFFLKMETDSRKTVEMEVFNVTGQRLNVDIREIEKNKQYKIQLSAVAGVYFIKIRLEGDVVVKKMVVE